MLFKDNLLRLREMYNITQETVADVIGLTPQVIGLYEKGKREPNLSNLIKLARFFQVSIDDLLTKDLRPQGSMLPQNLKYLRTREQCSQDDMAQLLHVSKSTMSKYERGVAEINNQGLINVSEYFGVTVDDLLKKDLSKGGIEGANAGKEDCG